MTSQDQPCYGIRLTVQLSRLVQTIYFDYNATTPLDPAVREAMLPYLGPVFGNPSSIHSLGRQARVQLDNARDRAASVLGCRPSELAFTSGGTESNNLAILGSVRALRHKGTHLIASPTEHPAVLRCFDYLARHEGCQVSFLPVDREGHVDPADVSRTLRPDTVLVSVMRANNETGTLQPVSAIGALCRDRGVLFHTDAVQSFGKEPFGHIDDFQADLVSLCAHKFHGPKGAGVLYVRSPHRLAALLLGGPQENEIRAGTENLAGIIGLVTALERFLDPPVFPETKLGSLTNLLQKSLRQVPGVTPVSPLERLSNTVSFTVAGCDSLSLLAALDIEGFCASSGSACSAGSIEPSHVLLAQGYDRAAASSFVRFSLGRDSTEGEVVFLAEVFSSLISRIQSVGR